MKFQIKRYVGTEPISLGMTTEQIENVMEVKALKFEIGIYAPFAEDEPDEPVEGGIVFAEGYHD